ncbi:hypothetical protein GF376_03230 [Candidatus Peregrinibacteria bacterium]|nr:hypothetical protein [Candidatus Peregrinibacteria bacterium]
MNKSDLKKILSLLRSKNEKKITINLQDRYPKKSHMKSQAALDDLQRVMRIKQLELSLKKMSINRSLV